MSTILKTLKKLEEEKSVLEKKLDLKELVLQDEDSFDIDSSISPRLFWKSALFLIGVVLAVVWFWKEDVPDKPIGQIARSQKVDTKVNTKRIFPVKKQITSSVPGIQLANISEQVKLGISQNLYSEDQSHKTPKKNREIEKKVVEPSNETVLDTRDNIAHEKSIFEIQSLIASAKSLAEKSEEIHLPQINSHLSIPSLKVKGIIFFSSGSSSNHIFVSNEQSSNHKMRVGDTINSATLMKIESTGAVFAYQGESVFLGIGQSGG